MFYKAVVQAVLLYGLESWVLMPQMLQALWGFHHQVAHQLTGKVSQYLPAEDRWVYPPVDEVLAAAGLYPIDVYLACHQNRIVEYVATRPIFSLCQESTHRRGSSQWQFWWNNKILAAVDDSN